MLVQVCLFLADSRGRGLQGVGNLLLIVLHEAKVLYMGYMVYTCIYECINNTLTHIGLFGFAHALRTVLIR